MPNHHLPCVGVAEGQAPACLVERVQNNLPPAASRDAGDGQASASPSPPAAGGQDGDEDYSPENEDAVDNDVRDSIGDGNNNNDDDNNNSKVGV